MKTKFQSIRSFLLKSLAAAALVSLSCSCSTTRGFGRDMQKLGNTIEREAAEAS